MASNEVSTRFPFINLEKALKRAEALYNGDKAGKPMPVPTAFELWGYSPKSSGGFQTVGALKMYGLLDDEGANEDRRVRLTEAARRFFLDERDDVRNAMLADFALAPRLFAALWNDDGWSEGLPADTVARSHLKIERGLNDQSARSLLSVFKDNLKFAGLRYGVQPEPLIESDQEQGGDENPTTQDEGSENMENVNRSGSGGRGEEHTATPNKPILFDMETVSGQYSFDNAEDLAEFIAKLERIKALMPTRH